MSSTYASVYLDCVDRLIDLRDLDAWGALLHGDHRERLLRGRVRVGPADQGDHVR